VLPGLNDAGVSGFESLFNCHWVLEELVYEQVISDDDRKQMVLGAYRVRRAQLTEPFNARAAYGAR
jgi:hypothetical protein